MVDNAYRNTAQKASNKQSPRGASHVVAGFRYQVLQSVAALLGLEPGEELLLEVREDYAVEGDDEIVDYQIKNSQAAAGPAKFSLQSPDVVSCLTRFWDATREGSPARRLVFMSSGGAAKERDHPFPNGAPGLSYWRAAAMGADTGPIRRALKSLTKDTNLGRWLESEPGDGELRDRLLRRVQWETEAASADQLRIQLVEQVEELYFAKGLPTISARQAVPSLMDVVFETASRPKVVERRLNSLDRTRILEESAAAQLLVDTVSAQRTSPAFESPLVAELESFLPAGARRREAVAALVSQTAGEPILWIHGSNGVGKSTLARLAATELGGSWLELDLRAVQTDPAGCLSAWRDLNRAIALSGTLDGVIIDDFDDAAAGALRSRLSALCRTFASRGARLIVTSHHVPSAAMLSDCGALATSAYQAPYFSDEDLIEIVDAKPSPPTEMRAPWCASLRVTTNGGHPLLVSAKVAGLRAQGWPNAAIVDDLFSPSEAVQISRDDARRTLLADLSSLDQARSLDAGELLRRIACVFDRVDEGLIRRLAAVRPPLRTASDALAVLKGSWLELLPAGDLRISPLLVDLARDVSAEDRKTMLQTAAEYWLSYKSLDARTLPLCFWNAFWGNHEWVLSRICASIETMPREDLRAAATLLSPMTTLATQKPLIHTNPVVAVQLRSLQFEVADASEQGELAATIARRLFEEISVLEHADLQALFTYTSMSKVLIAEHADLPPTDRISYALALRDCHDQAVELLKSDDLQVKSLLPDHLPDNVDVADMLFSTIVNHIKSSSAELDAIKALDAIPAVQRDGFLNAMAAIYQGDSVFVHSGWSRDQLDGGDMELALRCYEKIGSIVSHWLRLEFSLEVVCARVIILDEGFSRYDDAIAIVDEAIESFGEHPILLRQKSKTLGHAGRHTEAVSVILPVEGSVSVNAPFDRAIALRDAASSAAKAGMFEDSNRLIESARKALSMSAAREALLIGFMLEESLIKWRYGIRGGAVRLAAESLDQVSRLKADESMQSLRSHRHARALVGLFFSELPGMPPVGSLTFTYGAASFLESDTKPPAIVEEMTSIADNLRILAVVEEACGLNVGVDFMSITAQAGSTIPGIEYLLRQFRYENALGKTNPDERLRSGLDAAWSLLVKGRYSVDQQHRVRIPSGELDATAYVWNPLLRDRFEMVVLDVILSEKLRAGWQPSEGFWLKMRESLRSIVGEDEAIVKLVDIAQGLTLPAATNPSLSQALAQELAISEDLLLQHPSIRFQRDARVLLLATRSMAAAYHLPLLAEKFAGDWRFVWKNQRFLLNSPSRLATELEEALLRLTSSSPGQSLARLFSILAPLVQLPSDGALVRQLKGGGGSEPPRSG